MESVDIPFNITLNAVQFANSDVEFSHQLCFLGESADSLPFGELVDRHQVLKVFSSQMHLKILQKSNK
jgi:hypothetical protein